MKRAPHPYDDRAYVTEAELHEWIAHVDQATRDRFDKLAGHLPQGVEYGLAAHSLPIVDEVMRIVTPLHMVEIGFGVGASASMFLASTTLQRLVSIDWTTNPIVIESARTMEREHKGRFVFVNEDSRRILPREVSNALGYAVPELVFVDGGHEYEVVSNDIRLAARLGADDNSVHSLTRWILLDDWWPHLGPGVQPAMSTWGRSYEQFKQWGNMVLFKRIGI